MHRARKLKFVDPPFDSPDEFPPFLIHCGLITIQSRPTLPSPLGQQLLKTKLQQENGQNKL